MDIYQDVLFLVVVEVVGGEGGLVRRADSKGEGCAQRTAKFPYEAIRSDYIKVIF